MKHEWRKKEKAIYFPKVKPEMVNIPAFRYISISGEGNPNSAFFAEYIGVLYSMAYAIKMNLKKSDQKPIEYIDWTVYPLEGVWDINDEAKANFNGVVNKDDFVYKLMIRQPDFVDEAFFSEMLEVAKEKNKGSKKKLRELLEIF